MTEMCVINRTYSNLTNYILIKFLKSYEWKLTH